ncbi:MAG: potassium-transporting ATPase subunit KdpC [Bdellovibrionales bacterium]|nr:potassium-transporting ATPase subunit KdpC [Bdellovibrionales bacterium]
MKTLFTSLRALLIGTLLTGVIYPVAVWGLSQLLFPKGAGGSLIAQNDRIVGSELLAQPFKTPRYFWPRPSAADYATVASGASNLGPTSHALLEQINKRRTELSQSHGNAPIPADLLMASGSGLDPHISPAAAQYQLFRVAQARHLSEEQLTQLGKLVEQHTEAPQWNLFGKARVNVLLLNLDLDRLFPSS